MFHVRVGLGFFPLFLIKTISEKERQLHPLMYKVAWLVIFLSQGKIIID